MIPFLEVTFSFFSSRLYHEIISFCLLVSSGLLHLLFRTQETRYTREINVYRRLCGP
jgi:hypothetical protein